MYCESTFVIRTRLYSKPTTCTLIAILLLILLFKGSILRFRKPAEVMMLVAPPNYDQRDLNEESYFKWSPRKKERQMIVPFIKYLGVGWAGDAAKKKARQNCLRKTGQNGGKKTSEVKTCQANIFINFPRALALQPMFFISKESSQNSQTPRLALIPLMTCTTSPTYMATLHTSHQHKKKTRKKRQQLRRRK